MNPTKSVVSSQVRKTPIEGTRKRTAAERVIFRVDKDFKSALTRAAALAGVDESKFSRQAIEREIEDVLSQQMNSTLSTRDFDEVMDMLNETIPVSPVMREAANRVDSGRKDIDEIRAALKSPR